MVRLVGYEQELYDFIYNLQIYDTSNEYDEIKLTRHGRDLDGGYVVADRSLELADIVMSYGVAGDISFEKSLINTYKKETYAFDCGIDNVKDKLGDLFHFSSQCLDNDFSLYKKQISSGKIASFSQQIKEFRIEDKKIFIKMDIEGAEYDGWKGIFPYSGQITGVVMEIHLKSKKNFLAAIELTSNLNNHFYLLNVHGNNCKANDPGLAIIPGSEDKLPSLLELTYINKNLFNNATLSLNQKHPSSLDRPNCPKNEELKFDFGIMNFCGLNDLKNGK